MRDYIQRLDDTRTSLGQDLTSSGVDKLRAGATDLADKARDVEKKLDEAVATIRKTQPYFGETGDTR